MQSHSLIGVSPGWPRWLLHIPSMRTYKRQSGNVYDGVKKPKYGILSYTWGRFRISTGSAIKIHNLEWSTPAIDERHFTANEFQVVIQTIGQDVEWVWIDVACIDQRSNTPENQEEIGKQAAIFATAKHAYVWFSSLETDKLERCIEGLRTSALNTNSDLPEMELTEQTDCISTTSKSLTDLFTDPWWTSLWTLQEAFLSPAALMLSKSSTKASRRLATLIWDCTNIYHSIRLTLRKDSNSSWKCHRTNLDQIVHLIEKSGCNILHTSPIAVYCAAKWRNTSKMNDRIYAIMQVYGFRLGASVSPQKSFTLPELELQLAQELNQRSILLSQLFVHLRQPDTGGSWKINESCMIPLSVQDTLIAQTTVTCAVGFPDSPPSHMQYRGSSCTFEALADYWREASLSDPFADIPVEIIHLDATLTTIQRLSPHVNVFDDPDHTHYHLRSELRRIYPGELKVLLLGTIKGLQRDTTVVSWVAMIVRAEVGPAHVGTWYCRVGFCLWDAPTPEMRVKHGTLLSDFSCVLG